mgnify:CR=1 FL=1
MERLRKLFNEETRFHDVLGGIYAITYKGKSVTARTPEKLWTIATISRWRKVNPDMAEVIMIIHLTGFVLTAELN